MQLFFQIDLPKRRENAHNHSRDFSVAQTAIMKIFVACFFCILFSASATADVEEQKAALGRAVDNYGKVYGAWLLEKQCSFLKDNLKKQLKRDLRTIQEAIPQDPAIQNMHIMVEESAQEVASTPPFSDCGKESESVVSQAVMLANEWANWIRSKGQKNAG